MIHEVVEVDYVSVGPDTFKAFHSYIDELMAATAEDRDQLVIFFEESERSRLSQYDHRYDGFVYDPLNEELQISGGYHCAM